MATSLTFTLTISRVDEMLFSGAAQSVTLPGEAGQLTLLAEHEPIITLLKNGMITVRAEGGDHTFQIGKGICEVSGNQVTILVQA